MFHPKSPPLYALGPYVTVKELNMIKYLFISRREIENGNHFKPAFYKGLVSQTTDRGHGGMLTL